MENLENTNTQEPQELTDLKNFLAHIEESSMQMLDKIEDESIKEDEFWNRFGYTISTNYKSLTINICADTFSRMQAFIKAEIESFEI